MKCQPTQSEQLQVAGFGHSQASKATATAKKEFGKILEKSTESGTISLSTAQEDWVSSKPYSELSALKQKRSTIAVRKWYVYHDKIILEQIDVALPLEQKAQLACELRNQYRTQARQLMSDVTERKRLDVNEPNRSFSELLAYKMTTKGLSRDDALRDILETSSKTRTSVNKNTDWRTMMFEYNICTVADKTLFYKQCEALVKNIPHLVPEPLLHDVDDSLIQIYNHPDGSISVRNDCQVDALYIQSDFDINPYFNKN